MLALREILPERCCLLLAELRERRAVTAASDYAIVDTVQLALAVPDQEKTKDRHL